MKKKQFLTLILSAFLFALSTPLSKILLDQNSPVFLAALFYLGNALGLLPLFHKSFFNELKGIKKEKADLLRLSLSVIFGGIIAPVALLIGIQKATAATASLFLNFEFLVTALIAYFFFHEHLGKRFILSCLAALSAGIIIALPQQHEVQLGLLFVIVACFSWGFDNNLAATMRSISPETNTIVKGIFGGLFNLTLYFSQGNIPSIAPLTLVGALAIGFISYGVSIVLYIRGAREVGAARSQMIFALNPFLSVLLSWIFLKEKFDAYFFAGLVLMILAAWIIYRENHEHAHDHNEEEHIHEHSHNDDHHFHEHHGEEKSLKHTHFHKHQSLKHHHPHYPDIHHRHSHDHK